LNTQSQQIILVDENDQPVGIEEKLRAHQNGGQLHRAFSVFVFDPAGQMLLQRRSRRKYHFGGLWTNTCCSHPHPGELLEQSARARLHDEFGFDVPLTEAFSFIYRASDAGSGLTEHEFDHVLIGRFDGQPRPNPEEIDEWKWIAPDPLREDMRRNPGEYTPWFKIAMDPVLGHCRRLLPSP
jgi:isopentenyl-diphosphate Delta-isomerase